MPVAGGRRQARCLGGLANTPADPAEGEVGGVSCLQDDVVRRDVVLDVSECLQECGEDAGSMRGPKLGEF